MHRGRSPNHHGLDSSRHETEERTGIGEGEASFVPAF